MVGRHNDSNENLFFGSNEEERFNMIQFASCSLLGLIEKVCQYFTSFVINIWVVYHLILNSFN